MRVVMQDDVLQGNQGTEESRLAQPNGTPSTGNRVVRYLPYILILLAVLSGFSYVYAYGTNLFWGDDWCVRPSLLAHYADGTLSVAELWQQHNEHRIFFPKLVMLGLGVLTRGNVLADMYFSEVLLLAILVIFLIACRRQLAGDWAIWLMVPIAFLVFSVRQFENMLWGFQIAFIMVVAAGAERLFESQSPSQSALCAGVHRRRCGGHDRSLFVDSGAADLAGGAGATRDGAADEAFEDRLDGDLGGRSAPANGCSTSRTGRARTTIRRWRSRASIFCWRSEALGKRPRLGAGGGRPPRRRWWPRPWPSS